jgi:hypothetical protein
MDKTLENLLLELKWLTEQTDGVQGLNIDGSIMTWEDVLDKYLPILKSLQKEVKG